MKKIHGPLIFVQTDDVITTFAIIKNVVLKSVYCTMFDEYVFYCQRIVELGVFLFSWYLFLFLVSWVWCNR